MEATARRQDDATTDSSQKTSDEPLAASLDGEMRSMSAASVKTSKEAGEAARPALELGWTRVVRTGRKRKGDSPSLNDDECCTDPTCRRRRLDQTFTDVGKSGNGHSTETVCGKAIILLHDPQPDWFQGYLFFDEDASSNGRDQRPWGLLAELQEIDECLYCSEGGYRVVQMTTYPPGSRKVQIPELVEWTGGDMMLLRSRSALSFQAQKVLAGKKAVPYVKGVFSSILRKLETSDVLDAMPDAAVVIGEMSITVPLTDENTDD